MRLAMAMEQFETYRTTQTLDEVLYSAQRREYQEYEAAQAIITLHRIAKAELSEEIVTDILSVLITFGTAEALRKVLDIGQTHANPTIRDFAMLNIKILYPGIQ